MVGALDNLMDQVFPEKTKKIKNTDNPWITDFIWSKITSQKRIYDQEDRSTNWKQMKAYTNKLIKDSKKSYYRRFTDKAIATKDSRLYYQVVNRLKTTENPRPFSVMDLFPAKPPEEVAEMVADFVSCITENFTP